jgi:DNA-binding response OmpR family regulator
MATKLLIVDDEPFTVDMLQTFLEINGYETLGAFRGEDGLVMVKTEHPDLMILDLMMPDIEGFEVCQRIRAFEPTAGLPVLVISARADPASKERAFAAGADGYLVKPIQFPQLLTELNRLLTKRQPQPAAPVVPPVPAPESIAAPAAPQNASAMENTSAPSPVPSPIPSPVAAPEASPSIAPVVEPIKQDAPSAATTPPATTS